jgi:hypothetical protein
MVFNATLNNISVISWRLVLLVDETRVPGENHWPEASHWQTLSHNVVKIKLTRGSQEPVSLPWIIWAMNKSENEYCPEKDITMGDLRQVTDKLYHIMLYIICYMCIYNWPSNVTRNKMIVIPHLFYKASLFRI